MSEKIVISQESRKAMIELIKAYFFKERDEELGDLSAASSANHAIQLISIG